MNNSIPTPLHPVATTQAGEPKRQQQILVDGEWKDAHSSTAAEFPPEQVRFAEPARPEMPKPVATYADHSYPAYALAAIEMQASHSAAADEVPVDGQYWPHVKALADILDYLKGFPDSRCAPEIKAICREALSFRPTTAPAAKGNVLNRDWPEDFGQENGNYENTCRDCSMCFMGNKHRRVCKACATAPAATTPAASEEMHGPTYAELEALYQAQCECADEWADKYNAIIEKRGDTALNLRILELEAALASVNLKLINANFAAQVAANKPAEPIGYVDELTVNYRAKKGQPPIVVTKENSVDTDSSVFMLSQIDIIQAEAFESGKRAALASQVPGEAKPIDEAWGIWYEDLNGKKGWVGTDERPALLSKANAERDCVTPAYTPRRIVMYAADEITPTTPVLAAEAASVEFEGLLARYWALAFAEGREGVSHGSAAQQVLNELRAHVSALANSKTEAATISESAGRRDFIKPDEIAALNRFSETCEDGEGYDVPKVMMQRLACIGAIRRVTANIYEFTDFGNWLMEPPTEIPLIEPVHGWPMPISTDGFVSEVRKLRLAYVEAIARAERAEAELAKIPQQPKPSLTLGERLRVANTPKPFGKKGN